MAVVGPRQLQKLQRWKGRAVRVIWRDADHLVDQTGSDAMKQPMYRFISRGILLDTDEERIIVLSTTETTDEKEDEDKQGDTVRVLMSMVERVELIRESVMGACNVNGPGTKRTT